MLRIIGIIVGIVISAILLLQIDDKLNPEIEGFLAHSQVNEGSEAYFYLMGIDAVEIEDPFKIGKQDFEAGNQNTVERERMVLPDSDVFCGSYDEGCFDLLFSSYNSSQQLLEKHEVLLGRYKNFINMTDYKTLSTPSLEEMLPPYRYLIYGNRLLILEAIYTSDTALLEQTVSLLRQHLEQSDNLIGKILFTHLLSENIDVLSLLYRQQNLFEGRKISLLTPAEYDFTTSLFREVRSGYYLYKKSDRNSEFFYSNDDNERRKTPGWLVRLLFKPNMTSNREFEYYKNLSKLSRLSPVEFALAVVVPLRGETPSGLQKVRNYIGNVLGDIAKPNYSDYIGRVFDLNAKITIYNQVINRELLPSNITYIQNPYYNQDNTAYYSESGNQICLTGPLEDEKGLRCLRIKI